MTIKGYGQKRLSELREDEYFYCNEMYIAEKYKVGSDLREGCCSAFDFKKEDDKYSDEYGWYQEKKVERWYVRFTHEPPHSIMHFSRKDICLEYQRKEMIKEFCSKTPINNLKRIRMMFIQQYTGELTCRNEIYTSL